MICRSGSGMTTAALPPNVLQTPIETLSNCDSVGLKLWSAGCGNDGRREDRQGQFLYEFRVDEVVPPDHLVRKIDAVLDLGWVHKELAPTTARHRPTIDRPGAHDPDAHRRLRVSQRRYSCASGSDRPTAVLQAECGRQDPGSFGVLGARHERFRESDALRRVFERVVGLCIAVGSVLGGEAFSIDASLIEADVDKKRAPGDQPIKWPTPEVGVACGS